MSSYHYPAPVKSLLKTGAILHLLTMAMGFTLAVVRFTQIRKNGKPRRRTYKTGKMDALLMVRDERHHEMVRPALDKQPAYLSERLFEPLVVKRID